MNRKSGNCGHTRASALWGKRGGEARGRRAVVLMLAAAALALPIAAVADDHRDTAFVEPALLNRAAHNPDGLVRVIVQGDTYTDTADVAAEVTKRLDDVSGSRDTVTGRFESISAVAATLTGDQIVDLAHDEKIEAITTDVMMAPTAKVDLKSSGVLNNWLVETGVLAGLRGPSAPTIAIVDSGFEAGGTLGKRVTGQISMTQLMPNAAGDGRGHGTFVASLAAAAAPRAKLLSIDVIDDAGRALTSDVIAAADWILENKDRYGIRVANFSLHAGRPSSFRTDPLNRAVERLWHSGVVVVTSAGNFRSGTGPSGVPFAPANDPFVITVGASDLGTRVGGADDSDAPWTAYGRTPDGFLKPELSAPGRRLIGVMPSGASMVVQHPERVVGKGLMRMSGTSFSAAIVSGAAAQLLARNPGWTPDEVKGALMLSARRAGKAAPNSLGVGQVDLERALKLRRAPNPNRALARFLVFDAGGGLPVFDAASWDSAVKSDVSWDSASWADASWADASWADASWADASWADASWADASWADASWADASWADASWADASWVD